MTGGSAHSRGPSPPRATATFPVAGSVASMRVRIGISLGAAGVPGDFGAAVALLESAGVDSLWLPENVYGPTVEHRAN